MAEADKREKNIGHIGRKTVNGVQLGRTEMVASMDPSPSSIEEHPTKKYPANNIGYRIKTTETVSRLDYWMRYCSDEPQH